jgi:hypothetical protein
MQKKWIFPLVLLLVLALTSAVQANQLGGVFLATSMTGTEEANGHPTGNGYAEFYLNYGKSQVCWNIRYEGIGTGLASHVHYAPPGSAGKPVIFVSPIHSGCATVSQEVIKAIVQNPEDYYVNVHTAEYPAGAIRGQLSHYGLSE